MAGLQEEGTGLEQTLHLLDVLLVYEEHHHMIILVDDSRVVGYQHIIAAHYGTYGGTWW